LNGNWNYKEALEIFGIIIICVLDYTVAFLITVFIKFHIKLLSENKTTIENLEQKGKEYTSKYDKGS